MNTATTQAATKPDWKRYERMKQEWLRANSDATYSEYQAAVAEIAKRCGV